MANETNTLTFGGVDYLLEDHRISSIVDAIYPVGSIYMSVNAANPATLFGGTWEQIKGRFLLGTGTPDDNTNHFWGDNLTHDGTNKYNESAGTAGGEAMHTISEGEMPAHTHPSFNGGDWGFPEMNGVPNKSGIWSGPIQTGDGLMFGAVNDGTTYMALQATTGSKGNNTPHNNMPPYYTVYMWKRTA